MLLHDQLGLACLLVDFALCRNPFDEVFIFDIARTFANDRDVVLLPYGDFRPFLHFGAIGLRRIRVPSSTVKVCSGSIDLVLRSFLYSSNDASLIADDMQGAIFVERDPDALLRFAQCAGPCR